MTATLTRPIMQSPSHADDERRKTSIVLALILTCQLMIILDISVVITALPSIHKALHFSSAGLSWVQNAYTLSFGGLLLLGARAGDILGRRRVFIVGIAIFTLASMVGGVAQSAPWLLSARAVQGIGAAIAAPSTLALLTTSFPEGHERTRAVSLYSAVSAGGGSVGLVLGGMLTAWVSWRAGLFINVPIGLALIWLAPRYLPETARSKGRFDFAGAATSTLGMSTLVYGFVRAATSGWGDAGTLGAFVAALALLVAFVFVELRAEQPVTPLHLFASRERSGAYAARVLLVSGMFACFFFLTQYFQGVRGYTPLQAGFAFLPMTLVMFSMVRVVPRLLPRFGNTRLLIGGMVLALAGMVWISRLDATTQYFPQIALPLVLLGIGVGVAFTPLTAAAIAGVRPQDAGAASGLVNVFHQLGGSLGLGILVSVFAAASHTAHNVAPVGVHLAHAVATALSGSAIFLALAIVVAVVVIGRGRPVAAAPGPAVNLEPA